MTENVEQLQTRSQRQAAAAVRTYRWIASLAADRPINCDLIKEVHRMIVAGADDDHCEPGRLRGRDINVTFGSPPHRGAEGGAECELAFQGLCQAIERDFPAHDSLVQALALHYHFAAIHPFLDGNGRTARAVEALMLQRVGLKDTLIAMSNYYYEEKPGYLRALAEVRAGGHDLTPFLLFGLKGIETQCGRLFAEIRKNVQRALFRNVMFDLFQRLPSKRKRVIAARQLSILKLLLGVDSMLYSDLWARVQSSYAGLSNPTKAFVRDIRNLNNLGAIAFRKTADDKSEVSARLAWPTEITETEFFRLAKEMPKAKTSEFLP
jgi:Fic family protein